MAVSRKELDVVVAGLAVVDIIGKPVDLRHPPKAGGLQIIESLRMTTGGNVSNVGIDLAKLGFRVGAISRVGDDSLGRFLLQEYNAHGLRTTGITVDSRVQTSATIVSVDRAGERTFLHTRGCMARFRASDVLKQLPLIRKASWFAFGYLGLVPEMERGLASLFRAIKQRTGAKIFLDTGGRPSRLSRTNLKSLVSSVDCFVPSFDEAVLLTGRSSPEDIVRTLLESGSLEIAGVKLGAKGCYIASRRGAKYIPVRRVRSVVDTTGAGDAFAAGLIAGLIKGLDVFAAAGVANAVAASSVAMLGASTAVRPFRTYLRK
ncbi:MAG: carbohydrate kinase family protein [Bacteroidota bacterium]